MAPHTVLLLGGTGKVASRISPLLCAADIPTIIASRSGTSSPNTTGISFDWFDSSTWDSLFTHPITAIFLIGPPVLAQLPLVQPFLKLCASHGVKRIVHLSASVANVGDGAMLAQVSSAIRELGFEYAILRPTWFMENFSEAGHAGTIREKGIIVTATGEGKVPFVACEDIARVAFRALTDEIPQNTEHLILGPKLYSYDEVAEMLTNITGRKITHVKVSEAESAKMLQSFGVPEDYATMLAQLDTHVKNGGEEIESGAVLRVTGREPRSLESVLEEMGRSGVWGVETSG